jgi:Recombination directionality factor-like
MIKGLALTPPVLGRISIGKVVEKNGKRLPEKDDQFTITTQVQTKDGWMAHRFDDALRKATGGKLRNIPIRLMFNEPDLNFRAEYTLFDRNTGRQMCVGNGESCKRFSAEGIKSLPCPSPDGCALAKQGGCKPYGRLNVTIGDNDPLGSFIFRTTGFNSIRTIVARLHYFQAISGNRLACMPLELRLRGKSTRQSHGSPIYFVDITVRNETTLEDALADAKRLDAERKAAGFDQAALDATAKLGFANGAFEDSEDEADSVVEEFFTETDGEPASTNGDSVSQFATGNQQQAASCSAKPSLTDKLAMRQLESQGELPC